MIIMIECILTTLFTLFLYYILVYKPKKVDKIDQQRKLTIYKDMYKHIADHGGGFCTAHWYCTENYDFMYEDSTIYNELKVQSKRFGGNPTNGPEYWFDRNDKQIRLTILQTLIDKYAIK